MAPRLMLTRPMYALIALIAILALAAAALGGPGGGPTGPLLAVSTIDGDADADADAGAEDADADPDADTGAGPDDNPEAEEQAEVAARRREALGRAIESGTVIGQVRPPNDAPSAGWAGERPFEATAPDDWEPAVAADPGSGFVYILVTRYGVTKPCNGNCPTPYIALRVSADGGATFGQSTPLCA